MLLIKVLSRLVLILLLMLSTVYTPYTSAQTVDPDRISFSTFLQMLSDQPDFTADWFASADLPNLGLKLTYRIKIARKQDKSRREVYPLENDLSLKKRANKNYKIVQINKTGQPPIGIDPQNMTYAEVPAEFTAPSFDPDSLIKAYAKELDKIRMESVGSVSIDGHMATRIRMTFEGEKGDVSFYFAKDLKNLLIKVETTDTGNGENVKLIVSNISFDVPDNLFEIPRGYRRVDFDSFKSTLKQMASTSQKGKSLPAVDPRAEPLPPLHATVPPSSGDVIITTGIDSGPVLLNRPELIYTEEARTNKIEGIVTVTLSVGADGLVKQVQLLSGLPDGLNEEAMKAAYKRRYKPAIKGGQPVPCWIKAAIEFRLH